MTMRTGMSCFGLSIDPLKTSLDKKKKKKKKKNLKKKKKKKKQLQVNYFAFSRIIVAFHTGLHKLLNN